MVLNKRGSRANASLYVRQTCVAGVRLYIQSVEQDTVQEVHDVHCLSCKGRGCHLENPLGAEETYRCNCQWQSHDDIVFTCWPLLTRISWGALRGDRTQAAQVYTFFCKSLRNGSTTPYPNDTIKMSVRETVFLMQPISTAHKVGSIGRWPDTLKLT